MVGTWEINVTTSGMPQKVATAFAELNGTILGAQYTPIAYIGSQVVNGTNHAVLAEQLIVTGKDTKNIVLIIFNEKPEGVTVVNIERVVEGGMPMGGIQIDVQTDIPEEAKNAFAEVFEGFVGSKVEPFALLATQVTKGVNYIFAATVTPITKEPKTKFAIVTVNALEKSVTFSDPLHTELRNGLGYAFNW